jgi:hypothetical protein
MWSAMDLRPTTRPKRVPEMSIGTALSLKGEAVAPGHLPISSESSPSRAAKSSFTFSKHILPIANCVIFRLR